MLKLISFIALFLVSGLAQADLTNVQPIATSKDWNVFTASFSETATDVCAASVQTVDTKTGTTAELVVGKMKNADGSYSSPFVIVTDTTATAIYKGTLKIDAGKEYQMTLLQDTTEKALLARYADGAAVIAALKNGNATKVTLAPKGAPALSVPFSLRGSSNAISQLDTACL